MLEVELGPLSIAWDSNGRWGRKRFEVWEVNDADQMVSFWPEGMPKMTRDEAERSIAGRFVEQGGHFELVDLKTGAHTRIP